MDNPEKYRILNGIWKNYFIDYDEYHPDHHPKIYDENNNTIAETNNGGGHNDMEIYYNHDSRRKEEFYFNTEDKTVRYKSCGHWENCDIEFCHTRYPFILPSTTKDMSWQKELNKTYVNFIPSSSPFKRKRYSESIPEPMIKGIKKNILKYPNLHVKVFVLLGLNYGMRYSEVINLNGFCLKENELNPKRKDLYFYSPKIKKYRTLYSIENLVSLHIQTLIDESQENREHYNIDSIFIKKCNTKLGYSGILHLMNLVKIKNHEVDHLKFSNFI